MSPQNDSFHLPPGTRLLNGQYTITAFLGQGGFGITYRVTQHGVPFARAIKECFPAELAERRDGMVVPRTPQMAELLALCLKTFQEEVTHLARLHHPAIVPVMQVFPENGTVYMVLDFVPGPTLEAHVIEEGNHLSARQVEDLLPPILDALDLLHAEGILHRDIAPDNILLRPDGSPVLIDFGAARQVMLEGSRHVSGLRSVKDSYSPHEFYVRGTKQGPQSDLYSLAATLYRLIAGEAPPSAELRAHALASGEEDPYQPLSDRWSDHNPTLLALIDSALAHRLAARPANVSAWRARLAARDTKAVSAQYVPTASTAHPSVPDSAVKGGGDNGRKTWRKPQLALLALIAVMGASAAFYQPEPPRPDLDEPAVQPLVKDVIDPPVEATPKTATATPLVDTPPEATAEAPEAPAVERPSEQFALRKTQSETVSQPATQAPALAEPVSPDAGPQPFEPPPPIPPQFSGTQKELVEALQAALEVHQCRPGPADGDYGMRSERAAILFNLVAPESCGRLNELETIGDAEPTPEWRMLAIANLQVLESCQPAPVCGTAPGDDFYREFNNGCWYHGPGAHPNEYATWDGGCDAESFITGNGTLSFVYPRTVPATHIVTKSGVFERGKNGTGQMTFNLLDGTEQIVTYRNGVLEGPYAERSKGNALVIEGTYRNAQRVGEWTERRSDGYRHRVVYEGGKAVRGEIRYSTGDRYEGYLNDRFQYNGFGTLTFVRPNGNDWVKQTGGWRQSRRHGRNLETTFDESGRLTYATCREFRDGAIVRDIPLQPGQRCF